MPYWHYVYSVSAGLRTGLGDPVRYPTGTLFAKVLILEPFFLTISPPGAGEGGGIVILRLAELTLV